MQDTILQDYLINLAAGFTVNIVDHFTGAVGRKLKKSFSDGASDRKERVALEDCVKTALTVAMSQWEYTTQIELGGFEEALKKLFKHPEVGQQFAALIADGETTLDTKDLSLIFSDECGGDPDTLPGMTFVDAMAVLGDAFVYAACRHPDLQEIIQTHQLILQTRFLKEGQQSHAALVTAVVEILQEVRETKENWGQLIGADIAAEIGRVLEQQGERVSSCEQNHYLESLIGQANKLRDLPSLSDTQVDVTVEEVFTGLTLKNVVKHKDQSLADALFCQNLENVASRHEKEDECRPVGALEAMGVAERIVILGKPGYGKSTLVDHAATQLALNCLGRQIDPKLMPGWELADKPLPVRIVLRYLAANLSAGGRGQAGDIWDYVEKVLLPGYGCKESFPGLRQSLIEAGGVIFFDGLDEVSEADTNKRTRIVEAIEAFAEPLKKCRVIVTCRTYAYREQSSWILPKDKFPCFELAPLGKEQVRELTGKYYPIFGRQKGMSATEITGKTEKFCAEIEKRAHLLRLAEAPLLLTLMVIVDGSQPLPDSRADLYERMVKLLLAKWQNRLEAECRGETEEDENMVLSLDLPLDCLLDALATVALDVHKLQGGDEEERKKDCADISMKDLRNALAEKFTEYEVSDPWGVAQKALKYFHDRAGILSEQETYAVYSFFHKGFQEYLAAWRLVEQIDDWTDELCELVSQDMEWWREVFLLAAASCKPGHIPELVECLLPEPIDEDSVDVALLVAQAIDESNFKAKARDRAADKNNRYSRAFNRVCSSLQGSFGNPTIHFKNRAALGTALAPLGDSRLGVGVHSGTGLPDPLFCYVPGGDFIMGDDEQGDFQRHRNDCLQEGYWIAKYPVTVAQYRAYLVKTGKHVDERLYPIKQVNHPGANVSWKDAMAFCEWLSGELSEQLGGWCVRLPSEAEWEKSARGGLERLGELLDPVLLSSLGPCQTVNYVVEPCAEEPREYPWGKQPPDADEYANYEFDLGGTSPVGCFPAGRSPYGAHDMAGNVWEWTLSLYDDEDDKAYPYPYNPNDGRERVEAPKRCYRVLRGGSFCDDAGDLRCGARLWYPPDFWSVYFGFRVVVAPGANLES